MQPLPLVSPPMPTTDWNPLLGGEFDKPYWIQLQSFVAAERKQSAVFPPAERVFSALHLTAHADVRVVILGQDPYHQPGQAHGLCFSVQSGVRPPPSLVNIFTELEGDLGFKAPAHGNLEAWALQGVLLLNSVMTVRAHQAGSHRGKGWETFTDEVIRVVNAKPEVVVFVLWGAYARRKAELVDTGRHVVIESSHPSPFSADRGFFGSRPFSRANAALERAGRRPVDWAISA